MPDLPGSHSRGVPVRSGTTPQVTLASGSAQRSEILRKLGIEFEVVVSGVDELTGGDPEYEVLENARRKARARSSPVGSAAAPTRTPIAIAPSVRPRHARQSP